jgi:ribosomal-protein-alanine N-acetyltransferase
MLINRGKDKAVFAGLVIELLEGKKVNLRVVERDDLDFLTESINDIDFDSEFLPISQTSKAEALRKFDNPSQVAILCERQRFIIEKKEGTRIGSITHWFAQPERFLEIGYDIVRSERGKGYGTEAVQLMVDYLFLSKDAVRIQAFTDVRNKASQRVLEKAGFKREGTLRRAGFVRGQRADAYLYGIVREEWREPKVLR